MLTLTIKQVYEGEPCINGFVNLISKFTDDSEFLRDLSDAYYERRLTLLEEKGIDVNSAIPLSSLSKNSISDVLWALRNLNFASKSVIDISLKVAIFSAESVLYIYENEYPNDLRPRLAVDLAKSALNRDADARTARAADAAAYAAADAAAYAADADKRVELKIRAYFNELLDNAE